MVASTITSSLVLAGAGLALACALAYRRRRGPRLVTLADVTASGPKQAMAVFRQHGVVILRGFVPREHIAEMRSAIERALSKLPPGAPTISYERAGREGYVFYDDVSRAGTLKQMGSCELLCAPLHDLLDELRPLAESLLGEPCRHDQLQYFNKPGLEEYAEGDASRPTPPHQDGYYWMIEPQSQGCTCWIALDECDVENGCLRYVPGVQAMRCHDFTSVKGFSQAIVGFDPSQEHELILEAAPGDLLVHAALTIHRAEPNRSRSRPRRAVGATFFGCSARVDPAAKAAREQEIKRRAALLEGQRASTS